jgi:hypothetical protein
MPAHITAACLVARHGGKSNKSSRPQRFFPESLKESAWISLENGEGGCFALLKDAALSPALTY